MTTDTITSRHSAELYSKGREDVRGSPEAKGHDDRSEIIRVIEKETSSWLLRDQAAWESCWVQEGHAQYISGRTATGAGTLAGFEEIRSRVVDGMNRQPEAGVAPEAIRRENWQIRVAGTMAWATFDQIAPSDAPSHSAPGYQKQLRIMEKVAGDWLIACVVRIQGRIGFYDCPWVRVDKSCRVLDMGNNAEQLLRNHRALMLVGGRLHGRIRSNDRALRRSLAEADDRLRRCELTGPIPVVFMDTDDGNCSLCWVSISDEMIVVLLDDEKLVERMLAHAGAVYGLTEGQLRVAREIARGLDLPQVAAALEIGVNTVRTHVKRMFEKVGVKSQAALMRAILSVEAPAVIR